MEGFDLLVVLGSQVTKIEREYGLAPHTKMKADAAIMAYKMRLTAYFLVSGGCNFGVRYDDRNILAEANFSFESLALAQFYNSEAETVRDYMIKRAVPGYKILIEESSATTEEQLKFIKILLQRTTFEFVEILGILTMAYHHQRVFPLFEKEFSGERIKIVPIFAEDVLVEAEGRDGIDRICHYYGKVHPLTYRGKNFCDLARIREILESGKSIKELI